MIIGIGIFVLLTPKKNEVVRTDIALPTPMISNPYIGQNVSAQFTYPSLSQVNTQAVEPVGESDTVTIAPDVSIEIQKLPYTPQALQSMASFISGFNLSQTDVVVGAQQIPAIEYKGLMELDKPYQQIITIFVAGNTIYKVQLMYFSQTKNPEYESYYQSVLSSVEVN